MSPSGAPATFTEKEQETGSDGRIKLRIGDPDLTVRAGEATYVISYVLRGALRTFDGSPEFFCDVTGEEYPDIKKFDVNVTAPDGVTKARCLVGTSECDAVVTDQEAVLTGAEVRRGEPVSVVAGLVPGSVSNAEPTLEERGLTRPAETEVVSVVEVLPDATTHVEQEWTYRFPRKHATNPRLIHWRLPTRGPWSAEEDQIFRVTNLQVEGASYTMEERGQLRAPVQRSATRTCSCSSRCRPRWTATRPPSTFPTTWRAPSPPKATSRSPPGYSVRPSSTTPTGSISPGSFRAGCTG